MTREEAIHFAECLKHNWTIDFNDMEDFCDMAIEALSEPSGDLISRADAVKCVGWGDSVTEVINRIKALPSAEAKTKCIAQIKVDTEEIVRRIKEEYDITDVWIPCSEKLPDVGEIVIASWSDLWSDAIVFARRYCEDDWEWAYEQGSGYWESARDYDRESNPEAWMPLPEPYEPKTERRG